MNICDESCYDFKEMLGDLFHNPDSDNFMKFFDYLGYDVLSSCFDEKYSMRRVIFQKGDADEIYSNDEFEYMDKVIGVSVVNDEKNGNMKLFWVRLDEEKADQNYTAVAIIKIINKAFKSNNIIILQNKSSFAFGSKQINNRFKFYDFYLSRWYDSVDQFDEILEYSTEYLGEYGTAKFYYNLVDQIQRNSILELKDKAVDTEKILDYVVDLHYIEKYIGSDMGYEIRKLMYVEEELRIDKYKDVAIALADIGSNKITSYDLILLAKDLEEEEKNIDFNQEDDSDMEIPEDLRIEFDCEVEEEYNDMIELSNKDDDFETVDLENDIDADEEDEYDELIDELDDDAFDNPIDLMKIIKFRK